MRGNSWSKICSHVVRLPHQPVLDCVQNAEVDGEASEILSNIPIVERPQQMAKHTLYTIKYRVPKGYQTQIGMATPSPQLF